MSGSNGNRPSTPSQFARDIALLGDARLSDASRVPVHGTFSATRGSITNHPDGSRTLAVGGDATTPPARIHYGPDGNRTNFELPNSGRSGSIAIVAAGNSTPDAIIKAGSYSGARGPGWWPEQFSREVNATLPGSNGRFARGSGIAATDTIGRPGALAAGHAINTRAVESGIRASHTPGSIRSGAVGLAFGAAAGVLGRRVMAAVPIIGGLAAGGMAATSSAHAAEAYGRGELTETQLAAVIGGEAAAAGASFLPFVGELGAEGARAAQQAAGVPEQYQMGTIRTALADLGNAFGRAASQGIEDVRTMNAERERAMAVARSVGAVELVNASPEVFAFCQAVKARDNAERGLAANGDPLGSLGARGNDSVTRARLITNETVHAMYTDLQGNGQLDAQLQRLAERTQLRQSAEVSRGVLPEQSSPPLSSPRPAAPQQTSGTGFGA